MKIIFTLLILLSMFQARAETCSFENFENKICFGIGKINEKKSDADCESSALNSQNKEMLATLHNAFNLSPDSFKNRLCSLDYFLVSTPTDDFPAAGWSAADPTRFIAIAKSEFTAENSFGIISQREIKLSTDWMGRKFVGNPLPDSFGLDRSVPDVPGLYVLFIVAHEMGHVLYRGSADALTLKYFHETKACLANDSCTNFPSGTYGEIGWVDGRKDPNFVGTFVGEMFRGHANLEIKDARDFYYPNLTSTTEITASDVDVFYRKLFTAGLTSGFSLASPEEDWCDTYANLAIANKLTSWKFTYLNGESFDFSQWIRTKANVSLKRRLTLIDSFLAELEN